MAGKKTTPKGANGSGRSPKTTAASALAQAPVRRSERTEASRSRRTLSADELALRAWKTTYKNSRRHGDA